VDGAAVEVGDPAGDRQTEAGTAAAVGFGEGAEAFEDAVAVGGGDAGAVVGDFEAPAVG
jgi:hypothetical protein